MHCMCACIYVCMHTCLYTCTVCIHVCMKVSKLYASYVGEHKSFMELFGGGKIEVIFTPQVDREISVYYTILCILVVQL